ncbi:MAG: hypothetical protein D6805_02095, partial [Planctomycetota bacterium]
LGEKLFEKSLSPKTPFPKLLLLKPFLEKGFSDFPKTFLTQNLFRKKVPNLQKLLLCKGNPF